MFFLPEPVLKHSNVDTIQTIFELFCQGNDCFEYNKMK